MDKIGQSLCVGLDKMYLSLYKFCNSQCKNKEQIQKLENLSQSNAKSYWSLIIKSSSTTINILKRILLERF